MNRIKWTKSGTKKVPNYDAEIGYICLRCRPEMKYSYQETYWNPCLIVRWHCSVYFGNKWVVDIKTRKSLKCAQKDAEKLAIKYLFGCSFVILKELKKMGLLEEMLSEVGIDL